MCEGYASAILDEVCLEGLEGVTVESLWTRLADRFGSRPTDAIKPRLWQIVRRLPRVEFFELPRPRPPLRTFDRLAIVTDDADGKHVNHKDADYDIYPHRPAPDDFGSCEHYAKRKKVTKLVRNQSLEEIDETLLVIVGNADARWEALAPSVPITVRGYLNPSQYCMLERIGRSRFNGESSIYLFSVIKEDPKKVFYFRKELIYHGLITKQAISHKEANKTQNILLLHIPRFYKKFPVFVKRRMKLIENYLKSQDKDLVPFKDLKSFLLNHMDAKSLKVLMHTNEFQEKISLEKQTLYRQLYPDATEKEWKLSNTGLERKIYAVRYLKTDKIYDVEEDEDENEYANGYNGSFIMGESVYRQAYMYIEQSKTMGLSQKDLADKLGCTNLMARAILRNIQPVLHLGTVEINRQKTKRYYTMKYSNKVTQEMVDEETKIKSFFQTTDTKLLSLKNDSSLENNQKEDGVVESSVTSVYQKNSKLASKSISKIIGDHSNISLRKLRRINWIKEMLQEKIVLSNVMDLLKFIIAKESDLGESSKMDKRSLTRLLLQLEKDKQLKMLNVKVSYRLLQTQLSFVCEPYVSSTHPHIVSAIMQAKSQLMLRKVPQHKAILLASNSANVSKKYGYLPKFSRAHNLHEFLYYLVYAHTGETCESSDELNAMVDECEHLKRGDIKTYVTESETSLTESETYSYVPPLCNNAALPKGWILLTDVINSLPLCILLRLVNIGHHVPELIDYLKHPIKRKLLLMHLPENLQRCLRFDRCITSLYANVQNLCYLGLIQMGKPNSNRKYNISIYVNKNAVLWDTTSSMPSYHKIEEKEYPLEYFKFDTAADVKSYWKRLQEIASKTPLGGVIAAVGTQVVNVPLEVKLEYALKPKSLQEAVEQDNYYIPGDGSGAAGFDSNLFVHLKRSWHYSDRGKFKNAEKQTHSKPPHKLIRGQNHKPMKPKKRHIRTIKPRCKPTANRNITLDDVDKEASRILGLKRSKWNKDEDNVLFACKVALNVMHPFNQIVPGTIIRDVLHKCTKSVDKTALACKRRLTSLLHKYEFVQNVNARVAEIRRDSLVNEKYYNFFAKSNQKRGVTLSESYRISFVKLVHYLYCMAYDKLNRSSLVVLPDTVEEIYEKFTVDQYKVNKQNKRSNSGLDMRDGVIRSIIHSTLGCIFTKDSVNFSMLNTYRKFPEIVLRSNLIALRSSGMIAIKKKAEVKAGGYKVGKYNTSIFKLSNSYLYALTGAISYKIFSQITQSIRGEQFDHTTGGSVANLIDMYYSNSINLDVHVLQSMIDTVSKVDEAELSPNEDESNDIFNFTSKSSIEVDDFAKKDLANGAILNCCELSLSLNGNEDRNAKLLNSDKVDSICNSLILDAAVYVEHSKTIKPCESNIYNDIVSFIETKKHKGATKEELKSRFLNTLTIFELDEILIELRNEKLIRRIGFSEVRWISEEYCNEWCIVSVPREEDSTTTEDNTKEPDPLDPERMDYTQKKRKLTREYNEQNKKFCVDAEMLELNRSTDENVEHSENIGDGGAKTPKDSWLKSFLDRLNVAYDCALISPRPWLRVDGSLNLRFLWRLLGYILIYLIQHPAVRLTALYEKFRYIEKYHLKLLLEVLRDIGCVNFMTIKSQPVDVWSGNMFQEYHSEKTTDLDDDESVVVELLDLAMTKFALFKMNSEGKNQ